MTEEQYMKERVDDQIDWHSNKGKINKKLYLNLSSGIVISAAMIPFFSGIATKDHEWPQYVTGVLGVIAASLTGIVSLAKFQEKWTTYRITAESLQREKALYQTSAGPYSHRPGDFKLFVENIEKLLSNENARWTEIVKSAQNGEAAES